MTLKSPTCKLILLVSMFLLSSCIDSINNLSKELYSANGFTPDLLQKDGLAITPTALGSGTREEVQIIRNFLDKAMASKTSGSKTVSGEAISKRIGTDPSLKVLWNKMEPHISAHSVRGMDFARPFAKKLGVRFLLETEIQMAEIAGGAEQVRIYGRIFDTRANRIIWEGIGEGRGYETLFFPTTPATFRVIAQAAVNGLVGCLYGH